MKANSIVVAFLLATLSLLIVVAGATTLLYVADRLDQSLNPGPRQTLRHTVPSTEFSMKDGLMNIPIGLQQCVDDSDCIVVANHCGDCSCGDEINKKHMARYESQFGALCGIYFESDKVLSCDIYCKPRQAKCVEGICSS